MTTYEAALDVLAAPHQHGHHCEDANGIRRWFNPAVYPNERCTGLDAFDVLADPAQRPHNAVHALAHQPETVDHLAESMLAGTSLVTFNAEAAEGWRWMTHQVIEAIAQHLDPSTD